ncbi:MAG: triose-phosphate isomerase [Flavobacteriales bacterium]|nr:triose-phosphate isomerase [Flavobacteriales bacterium]
MRQKIVAGNWKMNKDIDEAMELVVSLEQYRHDFPQDVKVILAPPSLYLANLGMVEEAFYELSAQNCSHHDYGAFTGEISPAMLHAMNVGFCIIGHSERRQYYHETDEMIAKKIDACLRNHVRPIFCCGEMLEQRNHKQHFITVLHQVESALYHLKKDEMKQVIIAYEPVWAIGTGVTATTEQAEEMHGFIRDSLINHFGEELATEISILYGGSVNAINAAELFACPNVDGGLVGGASLKAKDFAQIIIAAQ